MAIEPKPLVSDDLPYQVEQTAREQSRDPAEVLEEAWTLYM
jgi:hypothetical protein